MQNKRQIYAGVNYENGTKGGRVRSQRRATAPKWISTSAAAEQKMFSSVRSGTKVGSHIILTGEVSVPHSLGYIDAVADDGAAGGERLVQRHAQQDDTVVKGADEKVDLGTRPAVYSVKNAIYSSGGVSAIIYNSALNGRTQAVKHHAYSLLLRDYKKN